MRGFEKRSHELFSNINHSEKLKILHVTFLGTPNSRPTQPHIQSIIM